MRSEHFNVDGTPVDAGELVRLGRRLALVGERAVRCVQRFDPRATAPLRARLYAPANTSSPHTDSTSKIESRSEISLVLQRLVEQLNLHRCK